MNFFRKRVVVKQIRDIYIQLRKLLILNIPLVVSSTALRSITQTALKLLLEKADVHQNFSIYIGSSVVKAKFLGKSIVDYQNT